MIEKHELKMPILAVMATVSTLTFGALVEAYKLLS